MREPSSDRRALIFIFITVLIDMIGFGIIIPVMPELIMELTGVGLSRAALYGGWLLFLYALMQFFFAPIIGNLSDRFGRRPVLLCSLVAFGFDYLLMGLAPTIVWLFAGRFVAGIAGATHSTANAYIADVSPPEERAQNFGLMGAAFGLGFILGPVLGGLLGEYGPRVPFFAAAVLALCNAVYGFVVLPETLPAEERRPFDLRRANPVGALAQMRRYPVIVGLFGAFVLYMVSHNANPTTWTYYTMLKFSWTEREVGYSMGFVGLGVALVQGGLIRAAIPRMGEMRAVYLGYALMSLAFVGFAFASAGWMMYAFIVPFSLGGLATPALRGIMSNTVPANAQGELQGALASVMSLTAIVAPLFMTQLFAYFTSDAAPLYFPGAPFLTAGVLLLGSIAVFAGVMSNSGMPTQGSK
ncbi:MAG: TCR/Tet family MFS transporter [Deltaproteobacteria bacterium]|nr:TCR/Tet family MFS transporter [Deltaproteobacteria bacterium]